MVYLNWKSPIGYVGHGCNITEIEGNAWVTYLTEKYPEYTHWLTTE